MFMGLETRSGRPEKLTAGIDCTNISVLPVYISRISILIFLVIEAQLVPKSAWRRSQLISSKPVSG